MKNKVNRTVLPIPDQDYTGPTFYDAKDPDTKFAPIKPLRPPKDAPNVIVILLDDVGFGASSAFGGPCHTPTAQRLAEGGLRYNKFHTTALCSPTRAALLTGRNHHSVGMGSITEIATSAPNQNAMLPNNAATIAKTLKYNGYSTAQFGKCHEVPVWENSSIGPFERWPTGQGFEKFYGFVAGETNQWYPEVYDGINRVEIPDDPDYHFMKDMTDKAIDWVKAQKSFAKDKPFFLYFAPGATHAPHHVPKEWADKYKGKFDKGWDALREEIFERQKKLGVIPKDAKLTKRPDAIEAWDEMDEDLKPVLIRQMEVYAGFLEYTDYHVGRLLDSFKKTGILDNTLLFYIIGDNGASAEGTINGTFNEMINFNGVPQMETIDYLKAHIDDFGARNSYNHYSVGWAHAMCTPYQWTKQVASHWGGTRNGTIVHWPKGIKAKGEIRSQFCHVIDVVPTILEAAGLPHPLTVDGVHQKPIEGTSMVYSFEDAKATERHHTQYFEMFGNRGIYHKGWSAVTKHSTPWLFNEIPPKFDEDVWELYDTNKDWTQSENLAKKMPQKLHELQRLWLLEAGRYGVFPLDDRKAERFIPELVGRPSLVQGDSQVLFEGMVLTEQNLLDIKNKSHSVIAEVEIGSRAANGVIIAQGANFGGWAIYAKNGKMAYAYNYLGLKTFVFESKATIDKGIHQIRLEFKYDGGGVGRGGNVTLFVDGKSQLEGRVDNTHSSVFSADSTTMIGDKVGAPICEDLSKGSNKFNGKVNWVEVSLGAERFDHLISQEEKMRIAMSIQ